LARPQRISDTLISMHHFISQFTYLLTYTELVLLHPISAAEITIGKVITWWSEGCVWHKLWT